MNAAPSLATLTELAQQGLLLATSLSLPIIGAALVMGLIVAILQALTQIQDMTLAHLPRFLVVVAVLVVFGPAIGAQIAAFAVRALSGG